jgi:hypothetical protein
MQWWAGKSEVGRAAIAVIAAVKRCAAGPDGPFVMAQHDYAVDVGEKLFWFERVQLLCFGNDAEESINQCAPAPPAGNSNPLISRISGRCRPSCTTAVRPFRL